MPLFNESGVNRTSIGWWILLPIEAIAVITISSFWRMLSFKESHLNERLSLLTIIIIGEGVIGVTKGVGKMWPTDSMPAAGVIVEVLSIVALLVSALLCFSRRNPLTLRSSYYGRHTLIIIHMITMGL
jgi:low temperature requirement protein LtrA